LEVVVQVVRLVEVVVQVVVLVDLFQILLLF
jgi:hypothetical protein